MQHRLKISANIVTGFLCAWILLLPVNVQALGFGNINMKSALNEPLNAEIELLSATSDDMKNLEVKIASREAFMRAGVDRSSLLSRIQFDTVKRGGKYYVTLTTQESVREPFLNFLLEMNWKSGRMLREYTVLLDPPDRVQRQQQVARAPETTPAEVEAPAPIPTPIAVEEQPFVPEPVPAPAESPFLGEAPAPVSEPDGALFPAVPLDSAQQVPVDATAQPELIPPPEPIAEAPVPEPMPLAPEPTLAEEPVPAPVEAPPAAFDQDDGGLFPQIPLRAYKESDLDKPLPAPAGAEEMAAAPTTYQPVGELDYGITRRGDSAWRIAEKLRPSEEISIYQIMMALQQSNPNAFVNGNIHRLKTGQVLRIDDTSLLTAMSKQQAAEQYQAQTQAWEEYLTSVGAAVPRQAIVAGETIAVDETASEPSGELTLATPKAEEVTAGTGAGTEEFASAVDTDILRAQARQAMEEARAVHSTNTQLNVKLNELEDELQRMENLVNVKDSDLASLQRKLAELNAQREAAEAAIPEPEPTPIASAEPTPEPMPAPIAETPDVAELTPEPAPEPSTTETEIAAATEAEPAVIEPPSAEMGGDVAAPEPMAGPAPAPMPETTTTPSADGGVMGIISGMLAGVTGALAGLGGMTMMIIIGVVLVVVLLLVVVMVRRKRGIHFQESILNNGGAEATAGAGMDMTPSQNSSLMGGGESSFLSDFAISGVSAIQAEDSEVDPLTEADVFMAYGRYEAAEERLQEAINHDPARGELRVKLLELYNTTKNKNSFETAAEDFYATLGDGAANDPLWNKVVAMGKQIAPGNPMFSGAMAAGMESMGAHSDTSNLNTNDVMDIGLDTGVFSNSEFNPISTTGNTEAAAEAYTSGGDLDFNLDAATSGEASEKSSDDLDFSFDDMQDASSDLGSDSGALDFNLDMDTDTSGDEETLEAKTGAEMGLDFATDTKTQDTTTRNASDDSMEFNMNMLSGDEETATDIKLDMPGESSSSLDFDLEMGEDTEPEIGMDMNLDAGDAAMDLEMPDSGDEVGTKLDLARAYIDMGDPDGARSILDEVMEEGNDGQKQEAQQLMAQIG